MRRALAGAAATAAAGFVALAMAAGCAAPRPAERATAATAAAAPTAVAAPTAAAGARTTAAATAPSTERDRYLGRMHRNIHPQFALGFLAYLEAEPKPGPPDYGLATELTIVVRSDGSIDRVDLKRPSGDMGFDVGAIDAVQSAAPFDRPPADLLGDGGLVSIDWPFHRDERACAPSGVDHGPSANDQPPASEKALQ